MLCPSCGSRDIEWVDASGDAVCVSCGTVCEESAIVSTIEFSEAGGSSSVVGQFVSENCSKPYSGAMHASARSRYGFMRSSRETTLAKGRAAIAEVAGRLRLQNHYIESAHRLFAFAVQKNFVQGRRTMHVVAVCLYIKCREEKSPHMLIDFSDALSVNVFVLGSTFLKFCRLLSIETPLIDPSLYIHRFAGRMDLGTKTQVVAQAALR
jgi:transcription factor IIIB subunit 2